jgi:hypothetical protein
MERPRSQPWSIGLTVAVVGLVSGIAACGPAESQGNIAEAGDQSAPVVPAVRRPESLDREAILRAVAQAASAHAAGADNSAAQRTLDGRQFEFRIRFGCRGPSATLSEQWLGWAMDAQKGTLRVRARPTLAAEDPLVQSLGGRSFEAVEGFWIPRPWLLQASCPAAAAEATAAPADEVAEQAAKVDEPLPSWPRIGIAQFFSETDPRTGRRSMRPYEAVKTLEAGQSAGSQGFDLVLSGRLKALPDKRVIACVSKGAQSPPDCIVSAQFDRVRIEAPGAGDVIAEWSSSG